MNIEVRIVEKTDHTGWYGIEETTEVYVDGNKIGEGYFQGEPEDRLRCRDFDWVTPLLKTLAESLGAKVEIVKEEIQ